MEVQLLLFSIFICYKISNLVHRHSLLCSVIHTLCYLRNEFYLTSRQETELENSTREVLEILAMPSIKYWTKFRVILI